MRPVADVDSAFLESDGACARRLSEVQNMREMVGRPSFRQQLRGEAEIHWEGHPDHFGGAVVVCPELTSDAHRLHAGVGVEFVVRLEAGYEHP